MWEIEAFAAVRGFIETGGNVLLVIAFVTATMWTLIIERIWYFRLGYRVDAARIEAFWNARTDHSSWNAHMLRELLMSRMELKLTDSLSMIRTLVAVCPMLGLLGTVTGMIQTFQAITMFGAGDPKMMAGGISEALVTTMLGLMTAAPPVLLYAFLSTSRKRILSILMGQSAGLVAMRVEESNA